MAFGGAGVDVLIANSKLDRLIDWSAESNTFITPFKPGGERVIVHEHSSNVLSFLYALSKSQGADQTRIGAGLGSLARNGEPFGELGLVLPEDLLLQDPYGAPRTYLTLSQLTLLALGH